MENENKNSGYNSDNSISQIPEINTIPPLPEQEPLAAPPSYSNVNNPQHGFTQQNNQQQYGQQQQQYSSNQNQYNPNYNTNTQYGGPMQINVPNSGGILALGILSILSICCCGPFLGPILAIIAIIMASKAKKRYNENPQLYKQSSYGNLKAGQICAIIGLALGILLAIYLIIVSALDPDNFREINKAFDQAWNQTGY